MLGSAETPRRNVSRRVVSSVTTSPARLISMRPISSTWPCAFGIGEVTADTRPTTEADGVMILTRSPISTRGSGSSIAPGACFSSTATACEPATETMCAICTGGSAGTPLRSRSGWPFGVGRTISFMTRPTAAG